MEDIKNSLDFLTKEMATVVSQQKDILMLVEEVKVLRKLNEEKDKKIAELESRVADLEQNSRMNEVVITGIQIKPRSYSRAVAAGSEGDPGNELDPLNTRWLFSYNLKEYIRIVPILKPVTFSLGKTSRIDQRCL